MKATVLFALLGIAICASPARAEDPSPEPPCWRSESPPTEDCIERSKKECEGAGGAWGGWEMGRGRIPGCNRKTKDAGKPCTDPKECEGGCISRDGKTGTCNDHSEFRGCGLLEQGPDGPRILCVD